MSDIIIKEIADNKLIISKTGNKQDGKEYFGIDTPQIFKGVENTARQEIVATEDGNIRRNAVESQEVYNIHKQKHHNWFILDLETGKRGYYPGCIIAGNTLLEETNVYADEDDTGTPILVLPADTILEILNMATLKDKTPYTEGWYKIRSLTDIGYIKYSTLANIRYRDPLTD